MLSKYNEIVFSLLAISAAHRSKKKAAAKKVIFQSFLLKPTTMAEEAWASSEKFFNIFISVISANYWKEATFQLNLFLSQRWDIIQTRHKTFFRKRRFDYVLMRSVQRNGAKRHKTYIILFSYLDSWQSCSLLTGGF